MLDRMKLKEVKRREIAKWSHRKMVASVLPGSELPGKIVE